MVISLVGQARDKWDARRRGIKISSEQCFMRDIPRAESARITGNLLQDDILVTLIIRR
jgi:hypothetical protein